jgi:hypothetical protein
MANFEGVTTCNSPKIRDDKYNYFLEELKKYEFPEDITAKVHKGTKEFRLYGYDWLDIEWAEGYPGHSHDAFDSFLDLLSEVVENSCVIQYIGHAKCRYPFVGDAIRIQPGKPPKFRSL